MKKSCIRLLLLYIHLLALKRFFEFFIFTLFKLGIVQFKNLFLIAMYPTVLNPASTEKFFF